MHYNDFRKGVKNMKVNVITGGGSGIGFEIAKEFPKDELVIISGRKEDKLIAAVEKLKAAGCKGDYKTCDVTSRESVDELLEYAKTKGALKSVVNCAGVSGDVHNVELVYNIDLMGSKVMVDETFKYAEEGTCLVLIASMMGHVVPDSEEYNHALANPDEEGAKEIFMKAVGGNDQDAYKFSKKGALLMVQENANRYGEKGARIVSVSPGIIMTEMALKAQEQHPEQMKYLESVTPARRRGMPEDIANAVIFLACDKASFITGHDLLVDGGLALNLKLLGAIKK